MNQLNVDCLSHIFLNLDFTERVKLEQVCRLWYHVLQQHFTYSDTKELNIKKFMMSNTTEYYQQESINFVPTILGILPRCGPYVRYMSFGQMWLRVSQDIIDSISRNCRRLEKIDMGATIINGDISDMISRISDQLKEFSLEETSWVIPKHAEKMQDLFPRMKNLERINLRSACFLLDKLSTLTPRLTHIDISGASQLPLDAIIAFLSNHPDLTHLNMCPFPRVTEHENIDDVLTSLAGCSNITHLQFGHLYLPHVNFDLLSALRNLRHLHLQSIHGMNEVSLHLILSSATQLEHLAVKGCTSIFDYSSLALCQNLTSLEITDTRQLTNEHFVVLASYAKLEKLHLTKCLNLSTRGIVTILMRCQLRELSINFCTNMTDEIMYTLASTQRQMEKISVQACTTITSKGVSMLAWLKNVHLLREADISRNRNIDDSVVFALHNALTMRCLAQNQSLPKDPPSRGQTGQDDECCCSSKKQVSNEEWVDNRLALYTFNTSVSHIVADRVKDFIAIY